MAIEHVTEPVTEIHDPRLLAARLVSIPAKKIRRGDWVALPGRGELSPVIGIYPCPQQHLQGRWICTDNGDWARCGDRDPVLRGDPPPYWPHVSPPSGTLTGIGPQVPAPTGDHHGLGAGVQMIHPTTDERPTMPAALALDAPIQDMADDPFALDVQVITDVPDDDVAVPCQTDDGCGHTCASACTSNV